MNKFTKALILCGQIPNDLSTPWLNGSQSIEFTKLEREAEEARRFFAPKLWKGFGFPIVTLTKEMFETLMATDPPDTWSAPWGVFVIEIGASASLFVADAFDPDDLKRRVPDDVEPEAMDDVARALSRRLLINFGEPVEFDKDTMNNVIDNLAYILAERPEGLDVLEHRPSAKAKRKQGVKNYSKVEYIIQPTRSAHTPANTGNGSTGIGDKLEVRTLVRGHYRQQPHGPRKALRRTQWIAPFWRGPEDGPISIHPIAVREMAS